MTNKIYAVGLTDSSQHGVYELNLDTGTWTARNASTAATTSSNVGAWDGAFYYWFSSLDRKLYRYDPVLDAVTVRGGGAIVLTANPSNAGLGMTCDGARIWFLTGAVFGYYSIAADAFTLLSRPAGLSGSAYAQLIWDYGNSLYAACTPNQGIAGTAYAQRFDIPTLTWTAEITPPATNTSYAGLWYANRKLYISVSQQGPVWSMPVPGGAVWTQEATLSLTGGGGATVVDADRVLIRGNAFYSMNGKTEAGIVAPPVAVAAHTYTLSIQPVFQFLESNGATPQNVPEPIGGAAARFFAGQTSAIYTFALRCLYPRNAVRLSVVPNPSVDIIGGVLIAPSPSGPWDQVANLGPFAAGQTKPYYIQLVVPNPVSPGTKPFTLLASSE